MSAAVVIPIAPPSEIHVCEQCGKPLPPPPNRRTKFARRFCKDSCRVLAHQRMKGIVLVASQLEELRAELDSAREYIRQLKAELASAASDACNEGSERSHV